MDINSIINKQIKSYVKYDKKILKITCITATPLKDYEDSEISIYTDLSTFFVEVNDNEIGEFPNSDKVYSILNDLVDGDNGKYDIGIEKKYELYAKYQHKAKDGTVYKNNLIDVLLKNRVGYEDSTEEYNLNKKKILNVLSAQYIN